MPIALDRMRHSALRGRRSDSAGGPGTLAPRRIGEALERGAKFIERRLGHRRSAFVAAVGLTIEPAAAAFVAGEFRRAGGIVKDHRQVPR